MSGTTTLTDAGGTSLFTSAMVGNAIFVNSLWYWIASYTDANNVVLERSDTFSGKSGRVGGASLTVPNVANSANATYAKCVPGNKIYLRASGSGSTSSPDYTIGSGGVTGRLTTVAGTTAAGFVQFLGENGMPYVKGNVDLPFLSCSYNLFNGIYFYCGVSGSLAYFWSCSSITLSGCVVDLNGTNNGVSNGMATSNLIGNEFKGGVSAASAGQIGIYLSGNGGCAVGNYVHDIGGVGMWFASGWQTATRNVIRNAWGDTVSLANIEGPCAIHNNTFDNGKAHGVNFTTQANVQYCNLFNNLITNFTGTGKYGIAVTGGATSLSDGLKTLIDYNLLYNCTGLYQNISAGAHDLNADPKYVSSTDYRLQSGSPAIGAGYAPSLLNLANGKNYVDLGAFQHQDAGGGGTTINLINPPRRITIVRGFSPRRDRYVPIAAAASPPQVVPVNRLRPYLARPTTRPTRFVPIVSTVTQQQPMPLPRTRIVTRRETVRQTRPTVAVAAAASPTVITVQRRRQYAAPQHRPLRRPVIVTQQSGQQIVINRPILVR